MKWYPTPSYLVKRKAILECIESQRENDFLEVGCGAGDLLKVLEKKGFRGLGIDLSPEAVTFANSLLSGQQVQCENKDLEKVNGKYSIVVASEVMEHHKDDTGFINKLTERLKDGGALILTVPAHMSKWGANDDFSGHVRRYDRHELLEKLEKCGLEPLLIYSYGVPIFNIMKPIYDRAITKQIDQKETIQTRTEKSGGMWLFQNMDLLFNLLFNNLTMYPFYLLQRLFYKTDFGNGYIIMARKPL